eukprot:TRINITY_DN8941_c0_g1_i2.p1 TRINITY_DN8941_c0_g1~~TRINITY_DN8941_c0_g1_i2.p1  ORF type:complete len:135 (-),score=20.12 TRINITY_DN8941_c0_g1_i2:519-875(-)
MSAVPHIRGACAREWGVFLQECTKIDMSEPLALDAWWRFHAHLFPDLAQGALAALYTPPVATGADELFSVIDANLSSRQGRLSPENRKAYLFVLLNGDLTGRYADADVRHILAHNGLV